MGNNGAFWTSKIEILTNSNVSKETFVGKHEILCVANWNCTDRNDSKKMNYNFTFGRRIECQETMGKVETLFYFFFAYFRQ